ncbi:hypothetical protein [Vampirovibrio sp.]|uniref:hypothetical protein n=1 Tax=Vampirovibrio sp. TaxID=2717857 RepID=UPI0035948AD0
MFKCKKCQATEFQLVVQKNVQGEVQVATNEFNEVIVKVGDQEFIADLMFMNQFAVCKGCDGIKHWDYFFHDPVSAM